jgi:hypothetical protein
VPGGVIHESDRNELDARIDINRRKGFKGDHTENECQYEQNRQTDIYSKDHLSHNIVLSSSTNYPTTITHDIPHALTRVIARIWS